MTTKTTAAALCAAVIISMGRHSAADDFVFRCSVVKPSRRVELLAKQEDDGCAGFDVRERTGELIQSYSGWLGSGVLTGTADGRRVVFLHSWPLATLESNARVVSILPDSELQGVVIFGSGKRIASFELNSLLERPSLVETSIGHVIWVRSTRMDKGHPLRFILETSSLRRLVFDLETGLLVSSRDSSDWTMCSSIAQGKVVKLATGLEMHDAVFAKGKEEVPIRIASSRVALKPGFKMLCLKTGSHGATVLKELPVVNGLSMSVVPTRTE